jgi:hypothetical protein
VQGACAELDQVTLDFRPGKTLGEALGDIPIDHHDPIILNPPVIMEDLVIPVDDVPGMRNLQDVADLDRHA